MSEEVLLIVDDRNEVISSATRRDTVDTERWRRASGGVVLDLKHNLILCHQRSAQKDERPAVWVCTFGGKVRANEAVAQAGMRELSEEFGIVISEAELYLLETVRSAARHQFEYVHFVSVDCELTRIKPDVAEVACYEWVSISEIATKLARSDWFSYGYELEAIDAAREKHSKFG